MAKTLSNHSIFLICIRVFLFDSLVIKLVSAIARFQSYLFLGVRYPEAILVAVLCDLSFPPSDSSFAPSDLLFNLRRAIYRFLRATGLFAPSDLSFAPSDLSFVPSDLSFAPSHSNKFRRPSCSFVLNFNVLFNEPCLQFGICSLRAFLR